MAAACACMWLEFGQPSFLEAEKKPHVCTHGAALALRVCVSTDDLHLLVGMRPMRCDGCSVVHGSLILGFLHFFAICAWTLAWTVGPPGRKGARRRH